MSRPRIELFFDTVSPYTYLAATVLDRYTRGAAPVWDVELAWRPAFLGGVMKSVGNVPPASLPQRAPYLLRDVARLSKWFGVEMGFPDPFPANTLRCMRLVTAVDMEHPEKVPALAFALWRRHWGPGVDGAGGEVQSDGGLRPALIEVGLDAEAPALLARCDDPLVKERLKRASDECVERGAFGFPAMFTTVDGDDQLFFGSDRVELLAHELGLPWRGPRP